MAALIDCGVVIGVLDRADTHHGATAERVTELVAAGEPLLASVITYAEVLVGVERGRHDRRAADAFFEMTNSSTSPPPSPSVPPRSERARRSSFPTPSSPPAP